MARRHVALTALVALLAAAAPAHAQAPVTPSLYEFTKDTHAPELVVDQMAAFLYYLRRPGTVRHFFTASAEEFCAKAREWGYTEDC